MYAQYTDDTVCKVEVSLSWGLRGVCRPRPHVAPCGRCAIEAASSPFRAGDRSAASGSALETGIRDRSHVKPRGTLTSFSRTGRANRTPSGLCHCLRRDRSCAATEQLGAVLAQRSVRREMTIQRLTGGTEFSGERGDFRLRLAHGSLREPQLRRRRLERRAAVAALGRSSTYRHRSTIRPPYDFVHHRIGTGRDDCFLCRHLPVAQLPPAPRR